MDESATRRKKIDPALYNVGWEQVPESEILTEQRAYQISPGQVLPAADSPQPTARAFTFPVPATDTIPTSAF